MLALLAALSLTTTASADPIRARLSSIVDSFYDLRLEEAAERAREIERDYPGHPAGPFYVAMASYQRSLVESPASTATLAAFEDGLKRTEAVCEMIRAREPQTAERYLGAAYGFHARSHVARRNWMSAIKKARKAIDHLHKAAALDPKDDDVQLGIGMYDYFLSRTPSLVAYLFVGMRGNRERGLKELERAAQSDGPSRMEARAVLAAIYGSEREKRWDEAKVYLDELRARYPGNPLYRLRAAVTASRRGEYASAREIAAPDGPWIDRLAPFIRERARVEAQRRVEESKELEAGKKKAPDRFRWPLPALPD
ncbi:MAG: hypothetical protein HY925_13130 [Elusimicrobia bacterium]|nr:hypothetical protein [Elusimicrobiota bacterium]